MIERAERHEIVTAKYRVRWCAVGQQLARCSPTALVIGAVGAREPYRAAARRRSFGERSFASSETRARPRGVDHRDTRGAALPQNFEGPPRPAPVVTTH